MPYQANEFAVQQSDQKDPVALLATMDQAADEEIDQDVAEETSATNNEHLVLGTRYSLELSLMGFDDDEEEEDDEPNAGEVKLNWFLVRLPVSTTLAELVISFDKYNHAHRDYRRIVQPICECLANLQRENHPLRKLELTNMLGDDIQLRTGGALQLLVTAAKQFGFAYLKLESMDPLPMEFMVEICHNNRHLNVLELKSVSFTSNNGEEVSSVGIATPKLTLDKLILDEIFFENLTMTSKFANLAHATNVSALELGNIICLRDASQWWGGDDDKRYDVMEVTSRIVSELVKPSVQHLQLLDDCEAHDFEAALSARTGTFLIKLFVSICDDDDDDALQKVDALRRFISDAVQLQRLTIFANHLTASWLRRLVGTMEAFTTITRIEVIIHGGPRRYRTALGDEENANVVQQLRRCAARNKRLALFRASPNTYPNDQLLDLLLQLDKSPTGRFQLVRSLPEILSFPTTERLFQ